MAEPSVRQARFNLRRKSPSRRGDPAGTSNKRRRPVQRPHVVIAYVAYPPELCDEVQRPDLITVIAVAYHPAPLAQPRRRFGEVHQTVLATLCARSSVRFAVYTGAGARYSKVHQLASQAAPVRDGSRCAARASNCRGKQSPRRCSAPPRGRQ